MVRDHLGRDVPAAVVAGRHGAVASVAIERPAVEELFQPRPFGIGQIDDIARQRFAVAATVSALGFPDSMIAMSCASNC